MAKDTSLLETATPWHSADVFTWYFWRQSDAHFRWRAIASHDTEKGMMMPIDIDMFTGCCWFTTPFLCLIYSVQLGYLQSCEHLHHFGCKIASFFFVSHTWRVWVETSNQDISGPLIQYPGLFGSISPSSYPFHSSVLPLCWVSELDG